MIRMTGHQRASASNALHREADISQALGRAVTLDTLGVWDKRHAAGLRERPAKS